VPIRVRQRLAVAIQIRWLREDLGLTQRELAGKTGVSQQQIAKLEKPSGNPTIGTLEAIARSSGAQLSTVLSVPKHVTPKRLARSLRSGGDARRMTPKRSGAAALLSRDRSRVKPPRAA
jgi:transcriptional regulator with XRE-family HTH domain